MFNDLQQFYSSDTWRKFRLRLIAERTNKADGLVYDEWTHKPISDLRTAILHHKQPLTLQNVNDYSISLNPENIMIVSMKSHNEIHARFGRGRQTVYIVHGAPCSGKTTFVNDNKGNSDMVIDIDNIWEAITGERFSKPDALKSTVFAVRDTLLDRAKRRAGNWERCWIVETLPFRAVREDKAKIYGAELIHINTNKEECLKRLFNDKNRHNVISDWERYINDYFVAFQE